MRKQYKNIKIPVEIYRELNRLKLAMSTPDDFKTFEDVIRYLLEKSGIAASHVKGEDPPTES